MSKAWERCYNTTKLLRWINSRTILNTITWDCEKQRDINSSYFASTQVYLTSGGNLASFPAPHMAFHRLQYFTISDRKLRNRGLGMRLGVASQQCIMWQVQCASWKMDHLELVYSKQLYISTDSKYHFMMLSWQLLFMIICLYMYGITPINETVCLCV